MQSCMGSILCSLRLAVHVAGRSDMLVECRPSVLRSTFKERESLSSWLLGRGSRMEACVRAWRAVGRLALHTSGRRLDHVGASVGGQCTQPRGRLTLYCCSYYCAARIR